VTGAPLREPVTFRGRVETPVFTSELLRDNRAGDPHVREVPVYLPPQASDAAKRFPVVFLLASYTGNGSDFFETHPWRLGIVPKLDAAIARGDAPPAIVVAPNSFTKLGGSQYVNSSYLGPYEHHLVHELVPWIDERYPTLRGRRAVAGKSSGGFGALHLAMRHPELFPVAASLSGDVAFEYCHAPGFLACLRGLVPFGGDPAKFLEDFERNPDLSGDRHEVINALAMSACYSPNPASALGFDLPFDLRTGARIEGVWKRWLEFDPLFACERHAANLRKLELLHLECGLRDEYHLQWGLRLFVDRLTELEIAHVHEEHEGSHRKLDHRFGALLPKLVRSLAP
jgi:hypothetical protein